MINPIPTPTVINSKSVKKITSLKIRITGKINFKVGSNTLLSVFQILIR